MAKQTINIGSAANDGTGSTLREAFDITNDNFTELYGGTGGLFHKIEGTNFTGSLLIGHSTTGTLSSAANNTGVGITALDALTTGDDNVAVGTGAAGAISVGSSNVAIGHVALASESSGSKNVAVGQGTLVALTHGGDAYNVAVGYQAGVAVISGVQNTLVGALAGDALTTGSTNVAIGYQALSTEDTRGGNVAIGRYALQVQNADADSFNTAVGYNAGLNVSTGIKNVILGGKAGDALTTGSNNIIIGYEAAASAVDVSNEVTIGDSNITNVRIPADSTLKIGASGDLQLEHLSSNSFIKNTAVGDLYIENQVDDGDVIFRCDDGSGGLATYFYLDGSAGGSLPFTVFPDSSTLTFGTGYDLRQYHNGTDSYLDNYEGNLNIRNYADDADIIFSSDDGSGGVTEYFKLDGGVVRTLFSKNTQHVDNVEAIFGNGDDLKIFHDGSNSKILNTTGDLKIGVGNTLAIQNNAYDENIASFVKNGAVSLYYDNSKKFETTAGGVSITGTLDSTGTISVTGANNNIKVGTDTGKLMVGAGNDLQIYHDGSDSYIADTGTGDLRIDTSKLRVRNAGGTETMMIATEDGAVELYHDDSKKLETTANGVLLTSDGSAAAGAYLELHHENNNSTDVCATINLTNNAGGYAAIVGGTTGANNTGYIEFKTDNAGTQGTALTLNGDNSATFAGKVSVGGGDTSTAQMALKGQQSLLSFIRGTSGDAQFFMSSDSARLYFSHTDTQSTNLILTLNQDESATFAGAVAVEGGTLELGKADTASGHINAKELMTFNIDTDNDDTNRYFAWYKDSSSGSGTELLKILESGDATFAGTITTTGNITANTGHVNIDSGYSFQWGDTHERIEQSDAKIEFFTNNTQQMTLSGNNLGIGTDSPGALLHLANTSGGPIYIEDTDATNTFDITSISNAAGTLSFDTRRTSDDGFVSTDYQISKDASGANYHRWLTANTERMRVDANGNLLVGLTSPLGGATDDYMNVANADGGRGGIRVGNGGGSNNTSCVRFHNSNGAVGAIRTSGSATAYDTSSDYRLKEDLKDFDGLDKVSKIPVYDFKWKVDDSRSYGVLAHELQEVVPNAVSGEKDAEEMQGVDYSKVVPVLIKAIQELEARVKTLENK